VISSRNPAVVAVELAALVGELATDVPSSISRPGVAEFVALAADDGSPA